MNFVIIIFGLYKMIRYTHYQLASDRLERITLFLVNQTYHNHLRIIIGPAIYTAQYEGKTIQKKLLTRFHETRESVDLWIDPQTLRLYEDSFVEGFQTFVGMVLFLFGVISLFS